MRIGARRFYQGRCSRVYLFKEERKREIGGGLDLFLYFDKYRNMDSSTAVINLAALAQESRLDIFRWLVQKGVEGACVSDIGEQLGIAPATLSFHLKELQRSGLLVARRKGRHIYYAPDFAAMNALVEYLTENCCSGSDCSASCGPSKTQRKGQRLSK